MEHGIAWLITWIVLELATLFQPQNRPHFPSKQEAQQPMEPMWTKVDDGEYNEQYLELGEKGIVTIFSDRDGRRWSYVVNGENLQDLMATDEYAARREVLRILK